ncbi:MAG: efflux RND transporter permease subunit [Candidatus Latescibacteria bacterium]|nr:efflux RND transporter permease subunit [Candidatus Latescibacterota bacterium]
MTLPEIAIKRPVSVLMLLASIVLLGVVALTRLPLAFMPDIQEPELFVQLPYENASPEQVERMVVRPVEDVLGSVKGLQSMWSSCDGDGGRIRLGFDWGADLHLARTEVWERIDRIRGDLPEDLGDIQVSTSWDSRDSESPILEGRLSSPRDLSESYDLLERKIIRPLERVPGVAQVRLDGVNPREVRINLRLADLELHGMDVRDVSRRLRTGNFDQSLGRIVEGDARWTLRTVGTLSTVEQIRALPLRADGLRLSDVADVVYQEPPLEYGRHLDGHFAVGVSVSQESRANTVEVCDALAAAIARMGDDPELQDVNFLVWFSQGAEIRKTLGDLTFTGIFGAVLAAAVLFLFLRRVSTTVIAVLCIPFSLIVTCGIIWAQGKSLNTLTLLGLIVGVGMLVDNAVVVMENIFRHREEGADRLTASRAGAREVANAVTAATLTSVIVFIPLIFNKPSEMNVYLKELAITVCLALLASLFISQTLIPLATAWYIRSAPRPRSRWMTGLEHGYVSLLRRVLRRRWLAPVIGLAVIASAVYPFTHLEMNFDTSNTELFVQINYDYSEELSLERKEDLITRVEQSLDPHRTELMARSIYSFWTDNWSMTRVYLEEGKADAANIARVRSTLRGLLPEIPGVRLNVQEEGQGWRHGGGRRVAFQLVGEDTEVLMQLAEEATQRVAAIPGLLDVGARQQEAQQELHIEPDRELIARYAVAPDQVADVVGLTYRGRRLPRFRTEDGEREMRLTLEEQKTESLSQLSNLPLMTAGGDRVPLAAVADFVQKPGRERIERDNRRTSVWVGARFDEGTSDRFMPQIAAAMEGIVFPYGYSWTFGAWQERRQEQSQEFLTNLLLALLLVFAVMAGLFESARQALALMISLPFAVAGAAWTLHLTGTDFDQPAAIGLLLLIGIVVNNGIVMLEHINQYRRRGMDRSEAMVRGGRERLRPILMTALTTLLGLLPMVIQKPSLGGVYYYSMALVIMGGLFVSTFLTSVLLPATATLSEDMFSILGGLLRRLSRRPPAAAPVIPDSHD